jgi:two-component system NtrC family sensor kinase
MNTPVKRSREFLLEDPMKTTSEYAESAKHPKAPTSEVAPLRERECQAQKLEAIGQLTAGIAHELNNPIGAILGFTQTLIRHPDAPDLVDMLRTMEREAQRCSALIRNMLTFTRRPAAVMDFESLPELVESALGLISPRAKIERVSIVQQLEKNIPPVRVNGNQIQQIVINLCTNALDAMPEGGVLSVAIARSGSKVVLRVSDTGHGMSREQIKRIFEPFFTTKDTGKGTGLGLSLVREIVMSHQGHVKVDSAVGRGTTFLVYLPLEE